MKRMIILILILTMLCTSLNVFAASEPTIIVSDVVGRAGESIDVTVALKNNPGIVTMRLDVTFDDSIMELTKVSDLGLLPGKVHKNDLTAVPYCLFWDNGSSTEDYIIDGDLVTLTFTLKENVADGLYPISISYDFDNFDIFNVNLEPVEFLVDSGSISVSSVTEPQIKATNVVVGNDKTALDIELLSPNDISGIVIVATYESNKSRLCNTKIYDADAKIDVDIDNEGGEVIQIMWWDSLETLRPISEVVLLNLAE